MLKRALLLLHALLAVSCASSMSPTEPPHVQHGFLLRSVEVGGSSRPFSVWVPPGYNGENQWPAILFLHGAGERGDEGLMSTQVGLGYAIRRQPERWPAIIVFPQSPRERQWAGDAEKIALAALAQVEKEFRVDPDRVYLTGLSMGGAGTWSIANQFPEKFAAVAPICGWVVPMADRPEYHRDLRVSKIDPQAPYDSVARRLREVPIWIWHGSEDRSVPVEESRRMADALASAGAREARYDELEGVGHNSWDAAYLESELAEWMLGHSRD